MSAWKGYSKDWMRVEAIRSALFTAATKRDAKHFGNGTLRAKDALAVVPKEQALVMAEKDDADFALLRVLTGFGVAASGPKQRMLELEALQLVQNGGYSHLIPDRGGSGVLDAARQGPGVRSESIAGAARRARRGRDACAARRQERQKGRCGTGPALENAGVFRPEPAGQAACRRARQAR